MSWGIINEEERLVPSLGDGNELKLEGGKPRRVKLLFDEVNTEPYSFFEHILEHEKTVDGKTESVFRTVRCSKTKENPNASCPLCDGQQARRRIRHACNVWDFEEGKITKLRNGEQVFKPIGLLVKMGTDINAVDFAISKTGTGRNDTEYSSVNLGPTQLPQLPQGSVLYNVKDEYRPNTPDEMKSIVESIGMNWDALIVPPSTPYPSTLQEALDHEMPNTKYKGQKLGQIWNENKGMIEFLANSNRVSVEKGMAQAILVALGGASIPGVPGHFYTNGHAPVQPTAPVNQAPAPTAIQPTQNTPAPAQTQVQNATNGAPNRQDKINQINTALTEKEYFKKGGYQSMIDTMKEVSSGKTSINEFTDAELDKMIEKCNSLS